MNAMYTITESHFKGYNLWQVSSQENDYWITAFHWSKKIAAFQYCVYTSVLDASLFVTLLTFFIKKNHVSFKLDIWDCLDYVVFNLFSLLLHFLKCNHLDVVGTGHKYDLCTTFEFWSCKVMCFFCWDFLINCFSFGTVRWPTYEWRHWSRCNKGDSFFCRSCGFNVRKTSW